jgi:hypothetical protein
MIPMKRTKYITIALAAIGTVIAFSSAVFKPTEEEVVKNIISVNQGPELPAATNTAFREGEVLTYRLHYGVMDAGIATLEVKPSILDVSGRKVYHVVANGVSKGAFDWFYKVRDRYETFIDKDAMVPWMFVRRVEEGGYKFSQDYKFNHYTKKVDVGGGEKYDVPAGTQDMLSAFYAARNLDLTKAKEGDVFSINSFVDKELWPLQIRYVGKETIETDIGIYNCLKFRPIVQKGRVFKSEEDMTIWITDDKNHIPVRGQAKILVGSIKLDITGASGLANPEAKVK